MTNPITAVVPAKVGTHNHREMLWREQAVAAEHTPKPVVDGVDGPLRHQLCQNEVVEISNE
ncbi:hypothetical protein AAFX91_29510, partial [Bradyrhizobium sp. 31Argb]|uniref:hypothetical protein n=1 Tax=Bradyrhizobium sp. 31Argb TaxID=3141247 RepID=UPI0037485BDD